MIPHEYKRNKYARSAKAEIRRVLNGYLADYMHRISTAQNYGDLLTAAQTEPDHVPMIAALAKIYRRVGADFAKMTIKDVNAKKSAPDPIKIDFWEEFFVQFARTKLGQKITWITNTTKEVYIATVQRVVEQAGRDGLSIWNTAKQIQREIGYSNQYRAERIARTEIIKASNLGTLEGGKNAGIPTRKEWLPIVDSNSREDHAAMAGSPPIDNDQPFNVGGVEMMYPGDEAGGAEHVINCRCALNIVPALTYEDIINS